MAFTGAATVKQVSDNLVRITGLSLAAAGDAGTIGLFGDATAGVQLPDGFNPSVYEHNGADVSLADSLQVWCVPVTDVSNFGIPIRITKGGAPFQITLTNDSAATGSAELEIYVRYH